MHKANRDDLRFVLAVAETGPANSGVAKVGREPCNRSAPDRGL